MDVLLRNLIHMMVKFDRSGPSSNHLSDLVKAIRQCGVSFSVWEPRDAAGKKTDLWLDFANGKQCQAPLEGTCVLLLV